MQHYKSNTTQFAGAKFKTISACVMVLYATHASLALAEPASEDNALEMQSIRIIGSQSQLLNIPGSALLIEQQDLEESHVMTTNEALRKAPGVVVRDEEGIGMRPNIGMRGLNPTRSTKVLLLEDGIPVTYAPYGANESYYHPTVDRFSSIEVLKGASQIKYAVSYTHLDVYKRQALPQR